MIWQDDRICKLCENKHIVEIGGKGKGIQQFKGIDMDKSIILNDGERLDGIRRPLFLVGFLSWPEIFLDIVMTNNYDYWTLRYPLVLLLKHFFGGQNNSRKLILLRGRTA